MSTQIEVIRTSAKNRHAAVVAELEALKLEHKVMKIELHHATSELLYRKNECSCKAFDHEY